MWFTVCFVKFPFGYTNNDCRYNSEGKYFVSWHMFSSLRKLLLILSNPEEVWGKLGFKFSYAFQHIFNTSFHNVKIPTTAWNYLLPSMVTSISHILHIPFFRPIISFSLFKSLYSKCFCYPFLSSSLLHLSLLHTSHLLLSALILTSAG